MKAYEAAFLLKAAGYDVGSYGGSPSSGYGVTLRSGESIPADSVVQWLHTRDRFPSATQIRVAKLEEANDALRHRVESLEDASYVLLPALFDALAGKVGEPVLCYVSGSLAWFTSDLDHQWGDDWNDDPLDCNAGRPYTYYRGVRPPRGDHEIEAAQGYPPTDEQKAQKPWLTVWPEYPYVVAPVEWYGPWTPREHGTVEDVNKTRGVWLYPNDGTVPPIHAGTPLSVFRAILKTHQGTVRWPPRSPELRR